MDIDTNVHSYIPAIYGYCDMIIKLTPGAGRHDAGCENQWQIYVMDIGTRITVDYQPYMIQLGVVNNVTDARYSKKYLIDTGAYSQLNTRHT